LEKLKNLVLDLGCCHCLGAHRLNRQLIALFIAQVPYGAQEDTAPNEKLLVC
jgi:hypothetical protein